MKTFFTSDHHWFHAAVAKHRPAGIDDAELIARWNATVRPGDLVYHLGDLCWKATRELPGLVARLHGGIVLVRGNHDDISDRQAHELVDKKLLKAVHDLKEIKVSLPTADKGVCRAQRVVLCHYALHTWNCAHHGAWHLHGHSHGNLPPRAGLTLDVGVDVPAWDFRPVSVAQLVAAMATHGDADRGPPRSTMSHARIDGCNVSHTWLARHPEFTHRRAMVKLCVLLLLWGRATVLNELEDELELLVKEGTVRRLPGNRYIAT